MGKKNHQQLWAHMSMLAACALWGLMAPLGKDCMQHGFDGLSVVQFRVAGAAVLFWLTSLLMPGRQRVPKRDVLRFAGAAVFGIICNQCGFTIGLSFTSPANASIMTTAMPVFAMVFAFVILHEPITLKKVGGVVLGLMGALMLILTSATASSALVGDIRGDLLCVCAQMSYAFYLSKFNPLVRKYDPITVNKWMFTWATIFLTPLLCWHSATTVQWQSVSLRSWLEVGYVVVVGTYVCYILCIESQRYLRPTVVSVYNYVQPAVAVTVSVLTGLGVLKWTQGLAVVLVVLGVTLVNRSKSRQQVEQEAATSK